MLRFVNICLAVGLVALAYVIYEVKYETRALDGDIAQLRADIETERDAVAVLRAEWSLLNRPERIERLAQKHLKLAPARPGQIVTLDTLKDSDFDWSVLVAKEEETSKPVAAAKPAPSRPTRAASTEIGSSWSTTVAAETVPAAPAAGPKRKAKPPILATTALPPVTVSPPGE